MSRKDYEALAGALKQSSASRETVEAVADVLASDNVRFVRARFLTACGLQDSDEKLCKIADDYGYRAGVAAGSWVIDGNTTEETARRLLEGLDEGDPEVMDSLPSSPLSGEWAGSLLPADVLAEVGIRENDSVSDDVLSAFEDGYSRGVTDEVVRAARAILS